MTPLRTSFIGPWRIMALLLSVACSPPERLQVNRPAGTPAPSIRADLMPTPELEGWIQGADGATGAETMAMLGLPLVNDNPLTILPPLGSAGPDKALEPVGPQAPLDWSTAGGLPARRLATGAAAPVGVRAVAQLVDASSGKVRGQAVVGPRGDFRMAWLVREATASLLLQVTALREDNLISGFLATTFRAEDFRSKGMVPVVVSTGTTAHALAMLHLAGGSGSWRANTGFRGLASSRLARFIADVDATSSARLGNLAMPHETQPACGQDLLDIAAGHARAIAEGIDRLSAELSGAVPGRKSLALALASARRLRNLYEEQAQSPAVVHGQTLPQIGCQGGSAAPEPSGPIPDTVAWLTDGLLRETAAELARIADSGLPD
ncbi:MAG: hypothetical protein VKO64_06515 [Candidatus Sericytochromatia bacterium]|nr:hypothetical protein [Candidatus Sericytochromatia bacterium]